MRRKPMSADGILASHTGETDHAMRDSVVRFYDELAPYYHLIYGDWKSTILRQAQAIDALVRLRKTPPPVSVLDCSCGIGTQAIGLASRGYRVQGTDLSPRAVERAQKEAAAFGVSASFTVADFRALDTQVTGTFDLVISCDNALPHLQTADDLRLAARSMWSKLATDGLLLVSIRDYDRLLQDKPQATMPIVHGAAEGRRIIFQVWDWHVDGRSYRVDYFIFRSQQDQWLTFHQTTVYRALLRDELSDILREVGFAGVQWHMPEETGYFQPIATALKKP